MSPISRDVTMDATTGNQYLNDAEGRVCTVESTSAPGFTIMTTYTYDTEGNIVKVDSGSTAAYVYDALNHRVQTTVGSTATEFVFNANGQRVSELTSAGAALKGHYYWGATPVAFYTTTASGDGAGAHFEHQDWEGTERMRTSYNSGNNPTYAVEGQFTSLPWGDAQTTASGSDYDSYHFAMLDYDSETGTDHAEFRQYSSTPGSWMRPDPYYGSYDPSNPQSFNRYVYAMDSPLSYVDPLGLDGPCSTFEDGDSPDSDYCYDASLGAPGYYLDGVPVPASIAQGALESGAAVGCPDNDCAGVTAFPNGEIDQLVGYLGFANMSCVGPYESPTCTMGPITDVPVYMVYAESTELDFGYPEPQSSASNSDGGTGNIGGSFLGDWLHEMKTCVWDIGLSTAANNMNPFSPGIGTAADITSSMSQASLGAAAAWSVEQGLTVPLRSSIVRAGLTSAETFGKASGLLTVGSVVYALGDGVVAEYNGCL